jgi:hypothetical protein
MIVFQKAKHAAYQGVRRFLRLIQELAQKVAVTDDGGSHADDHFAHMLEIEGEIQHDICPWPKQQRRAGAEQNITRAMTLFASALSVSEFRKCLMLPSAVGPENLGDADMRGHVEQLVTPDDIDRLRRRHDPQRSGSDTVAEQHHRFRVVVFA